MKNRKKRAISAVILIVISLVTVFSLTSCGELLDTLNGIVGAIQGEDSPGQIRERADALRKEFSEVIIDSFKAKDGERLKDIFCLKTMRISDIDKQISDAMDFLKGNITEYKVATEMSGEGMGWDPGEVTLCEGYGDIYQVKTDAGKWYEISFHMYYVVKNEDRKGVTRIIIRDTNNTNDINSDADCYDDDTYFFVGYQWNESYTYEAGELTYQAIKAISDGDIAALKEAFCENTLAKNEIEAKMLAAFEFFDGKAVFGETQNSDDVVYDGNHDFHIESVKDDVIIKNGEEAIVSVQVYVVNIETDTGKIYEMTWTGFLNNETAPGHVGMISLVLFDGENRCIVE